MEIYGTITSKWQLHIPVSARKSLKKPGRVKIITQKGGIVVKPEKNDIMALAGAFKVKNPIPADKIRDYIDYSW